MLVVLLPLLTLLFKHILARRNAERAGVIILSALIAHTGWHWMLERGEQLRRFPLPNLDAALLASAMRGLIAVIVLGVLVWLLNGVVRRWMAVSEENAEDNNIQ